MGGFYARLSDKNELLRALEERFFDDLSGRLDVLANAQRWVRAPLAEIVAACVEELVTVTRARRNLIQAFLFRASQDPELRHDAVQFRMRVSERITQLLLTRRHELRHPRPEIAIDLGVQLAFALMLQLVLTGDVRAGGKPLPDSELRRELERNFLRYLGAEPDEKKTPRSSRRRT